MPRTAPVSVCTSAGSVGARRRGGLAVAPGRTPAASNTVAKASEHGRGGGLRTARPSLIAADRHIAFPCVAPVTYTRNLTPVKFRRSPAAKEPV